MELSFCAIHYSPDTNSPTTVTVTQAAVGAQPTNDNFANSIVIQAGQPLAGSNVGATKEAGEPVHNYEFTDFGGKSVWWRFTAQTSAQVTVNTCGSNFDTVLAVYTGNAVNALSVVAFNDEAQSGACAGTSQSRATFSPNAGTTYHIVVDGYNPINAGAANGSIVLALSQGPQVRSSGDLDGVGRADILWRHGPTGFVGYWQMNAGGQTYTWVPLGGPAPADGWQIVGIGAFNGDQRADVLWRHGPTGLVGYWQMTAGGQSYTWVPLGGPAPADGWQIVGIGDFNGDLRADILWRHGPTGVVGYWQMNAGGSSYTWVPLGGPAPADGWQIEGVGDSNGDLRADILWRHGPTGFVGYWQMNAGGQSYTWVPLGGPAPADGWQIEGVGDSNGDLRADIWWRHGPTGVVGIWQMNAGGQSYAWVPLGGPAPAAGWQIEGVGDFNGDQRADALWRHGPTGVVGIWQMSAGGQTYTWVPLGGPAPADGWQIIE